MLSVGEQASLALDHVLLPMRIVQSTDGTTMALGLQCT